MTEKDRQILIENNYMLKYIIANLLPKDEVTTKEFLANVLANMVSNNLKK